MIFTVVDFVSANISGPANNIIVVIARGSGTNKR